MTKSMKRIHKVTIKRMLDDNPDTSWLGQYRQFPTSNDFCIDRNHADDCPRFWVHNDVPDDARECDCSPIGSREMQYFDPGSVEKFDNNASWIPGSLTDIGNRREYWRDAMEKNAKSDYERMEKLQRGDFCFIGIRADAIVKVQIGETRYSREFDPSLTQTITSGGLWGLESDSDVSYLQEVECDELADLRGQLHGLGFSQRAISAAFKNVEHAEA